MTDPVITQKQTADHVEETLTVEDLEVHFSYKKEGYPDKKILDGPFLQRVKGERKCEGTYKDGKKQGVWSYYVNNPHNPMVCEYYDNGNKIKQEVFHKDGHHTQVVCTYDEKEHPLKQTVYDTDGKTIIKLDVFQDGLIKEENTMTPKGKEQVVYMYNDQFKLVEKRHSLNDDLVKVEPIG